MCKECEEIRGDEELVHNEVELCGEVKVCKYSNNIKYNCEMCGKECEIPKSRYNRSKNHFCCHKCADKWRSNQSREIRKCEICNNEFEVIKSLRQRFCSVECQNKWQSEVLIGENANNYNKEWTIEDRTIQCDCCKKSFIGTINVIKARDRHFCSIECRQKWFAEVWSQSEEWKEESQIRAVKILEDGLVSKTNSGCQENINDLLNKLKIKYDNEKGFYKVAVDNYLTEYNLIIEVMGTYWHCDSRFNPQVRYERQVNRIRMDKIKHSYLKNNYNIEVLYLWEYDIQNHMELCENLILDYIKNKGILKNYHSLNYTVIDNVLNLNKELINPYMEWNIDDLNNIVDLSVKEIMCRKQEDKWINYECEYCGKECEELISHYDKKKTHCCSQECNGKLNTYNNSIEVKCETCGEKLRIKKSKYDKSKNKKFYCNKDCKCKDTNITFQCLNCGTEITRGKAEYAKNKNHFCCYECNTEYKRKISNIK